MTKFMLLFLSLSPAEEQMKVSPEEMQKGMQPWMDWFAKVGSAVLDKGMPLGKSMNYSKTGISAGKTQVSGFEIIQAENMDSAMAMVADHPHLMMPGASVEVLEFLPMPGM